MLKPTHHEQKSRNITPFIYELRFRFHTATQRESEWDLRRNKNHRL